MWPAINAHGLQLKGVHGTHTLAIPAVLQARAVDFRPDDVIFLAVKPFIVLLPPPNCVEPPHLSCPFLRPKRCGE